MTIFQLIQLLDMLAETHRKRVFRLREIAALGKVTMAAAGMTLHRGQKKGIVHRVGNLWVNAMHPPALEAVALSLASPSYISFESALYQRGILSQSPRGFLTLATTGRPQMYRTPWGNIQYIHLKRDLFFGFDSERVAYPEKAWLDTLYIRWRKGEGGFRETVYPEHLKRPRLKKYSRRYPKFLTKNVDIYSERPRRA